jgi:MscS family membrane protein
VPLIELFVQALKKLVEDHPQTRKDYYEVHMHQMDNSSLNILFYIFFEVADWSAELKARHDILLKVLELAENLGVRFAFPTQTLHMETFPGQPSLTPSVPDDMDTLRKKLNAYFDQNKSQD